MIQLGFTNGARAVINYLTNGHKSYPKERIEIFSGGRILTIDNFRKLEGYGFKNFNSSSSKQNKGHREEFATILQNIASGENTMSGFDSIINTTKATFAAMRSALENRVITIV